MSERDSSTPQRGGFGDRLMIVGAIMFLLLAPVAVYLGLRTARQAGEQADYDAAVRVIGITLEQMARLEHMVRDQVIRDRDRDGVGEYVGFDRLAEADLLITEDGHLEGDLLVDRGYVYRVVLPEDPDAAERSFAIVAMPMPGERQHVLPTLAIDESGVLHLAPRDLETDPEHPSDPRSWPELR